MSSKPQAKIGQKKRGPQTYRKDIREVLKTVTRDDETKALISSLTLTELDDFSKTLINRVGVIAAEFAHSNGGNTIGSEEAAAAIITMVHGSLGRAAANAGFKAVEKFTLKKNKVMKPGRLCKFVELR